jgi:hypothetical protein
MGARLTGRRGAAPGVRVSSLTPDNVRVLRDADARSQMGQVTLVTTATTATFGCASATAALAAVNGAIRSRKQAGQETRPLHAVRRKLEKLVAVERKTIPAGPGGCYHLEGIALGRDRAKCVDCHLVVDVHPGMTLVSPNRPDPNPIEARQAAVGERALARRGATAGVALPAQTAPQARYVSLRHGASCLVADLTADVILATCADADIADLIVTALTRLTTLEGTQR